MRKKNTAEKYYLYCIIVCVVIAATAYACFMITAYASGINYGSVLPIATGIWLLLSAPILVIFIIQYVHYRKVVPTNVQTVKLENPVRIYRRRYGFEITVSLNGEMVNVKTKAVLYPVLNPNLLNDYEGREAEVGYDEARKEWIVFAL